MVTVGRPRGPSVRLKLTLSYAGFLMLAGAVLLAAIGFFLLRNGWLRTNEQGRWQATPGTSFVQGFAPMAAGVMVFLLLFGLLGGWLLAGRMLAPLDRITQATRRAAAGSLCHRIRLPGRQDEFRELADAFDAMLVQVEAHVGEQRRFAANASHELRTPLAISKALLDVARNDPHHDREEILDRLTAVNTRAIGLTEALLLLSRAEQRSFTREPVDLSLMAEEAAETLLPLAEKHGVTLEAGGAVAFTSASPALLLQLTMNLVHNAIVHNLPEQGTVRVTTSVCPHTVALTVENSGEQVPEDLVASLTEPFRRGTERVHTDHAGVGLGLAIVNTITQAHHGTLTLTPRPGGGLRVAVELPACGPAHREAGKRCRASATVT